MSNKKIKCAIIGANGYLGRHLSFFLNNEGCDVCAYDIDDKKNKNLPGKIIYEKVDIANKLSVDKINTNVDYLFYFAGITGTKAGFSEYESFIKTNEIGLLNVLDAIRISNHRPIVIFPSSRLVYKGTSELLDENSPKEAKTIYASNKLACENYLHIYSNTFNIPYIIYRIGVPFGNFFSDDYSFGTIENFISLAKNKLDIKLYGDGHLKRTFTHVSLICRQISQTMANSNAINQTFNVAGEVYSLREIADYIAHKFSVKVHYSPWPELDEIIESGDTVFNTSKIMMLTNINNKPEFPEWLSSIKTD